MQDATLIWRGRARGSGDPQYGSELTFDPPGLARSCPGFRRREYARKGLPGTITPALAQCHYIDIFCQELDRGHTFRPPAPAQPGGSERGWVVWQDGGEERRGRHPEVPLRSSTALFRAFQARRCSR